MGIFILIFIYIMKCHSVGSESFRLTVRLCPVLFRAYLFSLKSGKFGCLPAAWHRVVSRGATLVARELHREREAQVFPALCADWQDARMTWQLTPLSLRGSLFGADEKPRPGRGVKEEAR